MAPGPEEEPPGREADDQVTALEAANAALRKQLDETNKVMWALYKELDDKNGALAASNEELDQFASIAGHDLQEPLRKVIAFGDRLQADFGDSLGERGVDYVGRMRGASSRMLELLDDLLRYARVTSRARPFTPVALDTVLADVVSDLETRIEKEKGAVKVGSLPTIDADPVQMRQLFQNLISNGLKFRKPDAAPLVTVECGPGSEEDQVSLVVADNGIGIDSKFAERIFEPFRRLHGRARYEGTGMGLAICKKIARRHQGDIVMASTPGEGSRFIITMPIRHPGDDAVSAPSEPAADGSHD